MMISIAESFAKLNERIQTACERTGRKPEDVSICAVTKTVDVERIREAYAAGLRAFGENYWQEAKEKVRVFSPPGLKWHFIGCLQTNKIKFLVSHFHVLQTLCSEEAAFEISRQAKKLNKVQECFVQVNATDDPARSGINYRQTLDFIDRVSTLEHIKLTGLMTMVPPAIAMEETRLYFRRMNVLFHRIGEESGRTHFGALSMGMSQDFETALEEGSTMLRVGEVLFGARTKKQQAL